MAEEKKTPMPPDDSIPQHGEGDVYFSQPITYVTAQHPRWAFTKAIRSYGAEPENRSI